MLLGIRVSVRGYDGVLGRTLSCAIIFFNVGLALQEGIAPSSFV